MYLKEFQDKLLNEMALKGIPEISKVTFSLYEEKEYNAVTGAKVVNAPKKGENPDKHKSWLIETDGVALQKVLGFDEIDFKRTTSNDI